MRRFVLRLSIYGIILLLDTPYHCMPFSPRRQRLRSPRDGVTWVLFTIFIVRRGFSSGYIPACEELLLNTCCSVPFAAVLPVAAACLPRAAVRFMRFLWFGCTAATLPLLSAAPLLLLTDGPQPFAVRDVCWVAAGDDRCRAVEYARFSLRRRPSGQPTRTLRPGALVAATATTRCRRGITCGAEERITSHTLPLFPSTTFPPFAV